MKLLAKIGKIIAIIILVPTISLCVLILFFAFMGKEFTPISVSQKTNTVKQENKAEDGSMEGDGKLTESKVSDKEEAIFTENKKEPLQKEGIGEAEIPIGEAKYILDVSGFQIHLKDCKRIEELSFADMEDSSESIEALKEKGFVLCETCNPN